MYEICGVLMEDEDWDRLNMMHKVRADGQLWFRVKIWSRSSFGSRYRPIMMIFGHFLKQVCDRFGIWRYDQLGKVQEWRFKVRLFRGLGHLASFWTDSLKYANVWNFGHKSWQMGFGAFEWATWSLGKLEISYMRCGWRFWGHLVCGLSFECWRWNYRSISEILVSLQSNYGIGWEFKDGIN